MLRLDDPLGRVGVREGGDLRRLDLSRKYADSAGPASITPGTAVLTSTNTFVQRPEDPRREPPSTADEWMHDGAQEVMVTLRADRWECILLDAETGAPVYVELAHESSDGRSREEMLASATGCRETIVVVVGGALRSPRGP